MSQPQKLPSLTIIIPTLNSGAVLANCLASIKSQLYPPKYTRVIVADGGSTDNTLTIAQKYNCQIVKNPLKTAEAGKSVGLKLVTTDLVALIDSDNILPDNHWLNNLVKPLVDHPEAVGSEPWEYTYRPNAGYIERYASLTGINDPYSLFVGSYDRRGVTHTWTNYNLTETDKKEYLLVALNSTKSLPTIGANGTVFRTKFLQEFVAGEYLFDVDVLAKAIKHKPPVYFIKVKTGIIHTYCEASFTKFIRKQSRRVKDLYTYHSDREFPTTSFDLKNIFFVLYSFTFFPTLYFSIKGFLKKADIAWFFHPFACFTTALIYSYFTLLKLLHLIKPQYRQTWSQ